MTKNIETFQILFPMQKIPYLLFLHRAYPPPPYPPGSTIPDHEYVNPFYTDIIYLIQKKLLTVITDVINYVSSKDVWFASIKRLMSKQSTNKCHYILDAIGLSGILKGKQKLGVTFNSDKLGGIDFTKFSKLTMCSA